MQMLCLKQEFCLVFLMAVVDLREPLFHLILFVELVAEVDLIQNLAHLMIALIFFSLQLSSVKK